MTTVPRVLVADDSLTMRVLLERTLQSAGYEVMTATNGEELVVTAKQHMPDLLIVDLMMPVMDGYEAIRQLRNDTRTAHLPMIVVTTVDESRGMVRAFDSGADDLVNKPFDLDVLLARIRRQLVRARQRPISNPLTGLPGNVLLENEIERLLLSKQQAMFLYIDLDYFKVINDVYGFARGDRTIQLLAHVLRSVISEKDFLAHIGGDDFAILHTGNEIETLCQAIITSFDGAIETLYDESDWERGYLIAPDRQGRMSRFGIVSLSLAAVHIIPGRFPNVDEVSKQVALVKKRSKQIHGHSYLIDTIETPNEEPRMNEMKS